MLKILRRNLNLVIVKMLKLPSYKEIVVSSLAHDCSKATRVRILDLGGGGGKLWEDLKCPCMQITIIDPWIPERGFVDPADIRMVGTFQELSKGLVSKSFDFVVAMDVIEHLSVSEGYLLLYEMVRLSKGKVSIYTPNGFLWQPPSDNNSFNAHVSGWSIKQLKEFGFTDFKGHVGLRWFWGAYSVVKFSFEKRSFVVASLIGNSLIKLLPRLAFAISATAEVNNFPAPIDQGI